MMPRDQRRANAVAATVAALVGVAGAVHAAGMATSEDLAAETLLQRFVSQSSRSGGTVRAVRHLEAGTRGGKHQAWMQVETTVTPAGFDWRVIGEGGSERTRDRVLRAVLRAEQGSWRPAARAAAALTPTNYEFTPAGTLSNGRTRFHLKPRRADSNLVVGTLTVSADGHPLLLEGRLSKSPSFWVKSVTVTKRFQRVGEVSLPVVIESIADLKMFGLSSFTMRYQYTHVNGRSVNHVAVLPAPPALARTH